MKDVITISKEQFDEVIGNVISNTIKDFDEKVGSNGKETMVFMLIGAMFGANIRKELFKEGE